MNQRDKINRGVYRDLGFGNKNPERGGRLINKNGSFNVDRQGLPFFRSFSFYHYLLKISWPKFALIVLSTYFVANTLFGILYFIIGAEHLGGMTGQTEIEEFWECFFFSAQTLTTVGYGRINPIGFLTNTVAALESLSGLLSFAIITGVFYGRFAKPNADIIFSENAIVAPYHGITAFMFRIANARENQLIDAEAELALSKIEIIDGKPIRKYYELPLERTKLQFFPTSWTIVHPIDENSPLYRINHEEFDKSDAEFLILIRAFDDTFSQTVHARSSYIYNEVVWNVKFKSIFRRTEKGNTVLDLDRINDFEPAEILQSVG